MQVYLIELANNPGINNAMDIKGYSAQTALELGSLIAKTTGTVWQWRWNKWIICSVAGAL